MQVDTRDISNLLGRAGFTLLTIDIDEVKVGYPSVWELMDDLKDMGEGNAVIGRLDIQLSHVIRQLIPGTFIFTAGLSFIETLSRPPPQYIKVILYDLY